MVDEGGSERLIEAVGDVARQVVVITVYHRRRRAAHVQVKLRRRIDSGLCAALNAQTGRGVADVKRRAAGVDYRAFANGLNAGREGCARRDGQACAVKFRTVLIAKNSGIPVVGTGRIVARFRQSDPGFWPYGQKAHLILPAAAQLRHRVGGKIHRRPALGANADGAAALESDRPAQRGGGDAAALSVDPYRRVEAAVQGIGAAGDVDRAAGKDAGALAVAGNDLDAGAAVAVEVDGAGVAHQPAAAGIDRQQADVFCRSELRPAVDINSAVVKRNRFRAILDAHRYAVLHFAAEHDAPVVNDRRVKRLRNGADAAALVNRHILRGIAFIILRRAANVDNAARTVDKAGVVGIEHHASAAAAAGGVRHADIHIAVVDPQRVA